MKLELNQTHEFIVKARHPWNDTELEVTEGEEYEFTANGKWWDLNFSTTANGYTNSYMQLFDSKKRDKENMWFALMGSINKNEEKYYFIGEKNVVPFQESGLLYCFANDVKGFYWNNFGQLKVLVKRLK